MQGSSGIAISHKLSTREKQLAVAAAAIAAAMNISLY